MLLFTVTQAEFQFYTVKIIRLVKLKILSPIAALKHVNSTLRTALFQLRKLSYTSCLINDHLVFELDTELK